MVRHFTQLSQRTFGIDLGFYPLGSCTMKYNPRINDAMAGKREFAQLHPYTPDELAQGALQIMYELERSLASLFGMAAFSLNPVGRRACGTCGAADRQEVFQRSRREQAR